MQDDALAAQYRGYIAALNTQRFDGLQDFVHDHVVHNDRELSRAEYQAMLADHADAIPDLRYDVVSLLAGDDEVAARILFRCTPVREWAGFAPTGATISFAEHAFYRFRAGRIARVWSLLDTDAITAQLGGGQAHPGA